jgi:two-component system, OmpR family, phosphate regulon sensor histidine kinase PhoR
VKKSLLKASIVLRWLYQKRGFIMRALICWVFSLFFLKFDENGNYDIRFELRGEQKVTQSVVLVTLKTSDFSKMYDLKTSTLIKSTELADLSDSFYWDKQLWLNILSNILKENPKKVGVSIYFGNNIGQVNLTNEELSLFRDPRIIWASNTSEPEKLALPFAARANKSNIAHIDNMKDDDGVVRRVLSNSDTLPNLATRLVDKPNAISNLSVINYKGHNLFTEISLNDLLSKSLPANFFKDKIVIIGTEQSTNSQIQTPIGVMPRHEFWATIVDNALSDGFIKKLSSYLYASFLLLFTLIAILIITHYPQGIAFFFLVWLGTLTAAFSAWAFDGFSVWIPIVSPTSLLIFIWVLFIGYQALKIEQAHTRLQQQQNYLAELEQLKNNFVSLISHDLKTPIAKIQGVLDRLLTDHNNTSNPALNEDLTSLKEYSEELNRYIQSILKVLRVESRDFKILKETADINGIIETAVERLSPLARSKKIAISTNLEPMFLIEIDVTLMTEVFLNIIENAIKYTPENGNVNIRSYETEKDVFVEVSDSGEGITAEDQEIIWKKFTRGKAQDYKTKGSGLGLYLVKYFIELHGGEITMQSQLKKGTKFTVRLPIDSAEAIVEV